MKVLALAQGKVAESDTTVIGQIMPWPFDDVPSGWAACDGAIYEVASHPVAGPLFGSTFGGNGVTTFGVPTLANPAAHVRYVVALEGTAPTTTPKPMTLTGTLPAPATVGVVYHGTLTLGGSFAGPVAVDAAAGAIPAWLVPTVSGKTVAFDGTPDAEAVVTFTPRAIDADSQAASAASQTITVHAASGWATWGAIGTNTVLSNGDQTMSGTNTESYGNARAPSPLAGKAYFEVVASIAPESFVTGVGVAGWDGASTPGSFIGAYGDADAGAYVRDDGYGTINYYVYFGGTAIFSGLSVGASVAPNYRIGVAVDTATRAMWLRSVWDGGGGDWAGGGDPAAGTNPTAVLKGTNPIYAAASSKAPASGACTATLISAPADMLGAAPAGFTAGVSA